MKKLLSLIVLLALFLLMGCVKSTVPDETIIPDDTTPTDENPLVGFSDYVNIKRATIKSEYVDIILANSNLKGINEITIIHEDEEELVFLNSTGAYYRYKEGTLEEHDIFNLLDDEMIYTTGVLGYDKDRSILYAIRSQAQLQGVGEIDLILEYNLNTREAIRLPLELGRDPKFVHAGMNGYIIEAFDKISVFDGSFELIKEYTDAVFLGSSRYQMNKDNVVMLVGENVNNECKVTLYRGSSSSTVMLNDSCSTVNRLNVLSPYVYFIINKKLYQFDAVTDTFNIVPLSTEGELVEYVVSDEEYTYHAVFALGLSENHVTVFNRNMNILQSSNAMDVIQVGETFYLAQKPNTNDFYVYNFDHLEMIEIEEDFASTRVNNNYLIINTIDCTVFNCQNIYKNGVELILSGVMRFNAVDKDNAVYLVNRTDTSYDIMHTNFETDVTTKLMSLNYNYSSYINFSPIQTLSNGMIIIKDDETRNYHLFDRHGTLIETTVYVGYNKNAYGAPQVYLLRKNGEVIALDYFQ